jgi:hypothetical protein
VHFACERPKSTHKVPRLGQLALAQDDNAYNAIDLFFFTQPHKIKRDDYEFGRKCYSYFVQEHPELFDIPPKYTETDELSFAQDYTLHRSQERFWLACRTAGKEMPMYYNGKPIMMGKLLNELGMPKFTQTEIGVVTAKHISDPVFRPLLLNEAYSNKLLLPTFYAPGKLASLEIILNPKDIADRKMIYRNPEPGWYGRLGGSVVGDIRNLFEIEGCTWSQKIVGWSDKVLNLHHSLKPQQCIEIWQHTEEIASNCNPLSLIKTPDLHKEIKGTLGKLTIKKMKELEAITGIPLKQAWIKEKTSEVNISGTKFLRIDDRYYYTIGKNTYEFTNFAMELSEIKKVGDVYYQFGSIIKDGEIAAFKIKCKAFISQYSLLKEMTDIMLDAGLGTPRVTPNYKNYLPNVIEAFNPENDQEMPKPAAKELTVPDLD